MQDPEFIRNVLEKHKKRNLLLEYYYLAEASVLFLFLILAIAYFSDYWIKSLLSIPLALLMLRVFNLYHDCIHGVFLKGFVKQLFLKVSTIATFVPPKAWANGHHRHHSDVETNELNPISIFLEHKARFDKKSRFQKEFYRLIHNFWFHSFAALFTVWPYSFWILPLTKRFRKYAADILLAALTFVCFWGAYGWLFGWENYLFVLLLAPFTAAFIGEYFFYVSHVFEGASYANNGSRHEKIRDNSACIKMPAILSWCVYNTNIHYIHHFSPIIPGYNLRKCHDEVKTHLKPIYVDYLSVSLFKHSCQALLWDPDASQIIFKSEA